MSDSSDCEIVGEERPCPKCGELMYVDEDDDGEEICMDCFMKTCSVCGGWKSEDAQMCSTCELDWYERAASAEGE